MLTGRVAPGDRSHGAEPPVGRLRCRPARRARSWAPSSTRAPGDGVVVATGTATAFGKIAVGLGERPGRDRLPGRAARASRPCWCEVAGVLTVSIFVDQRRPRPAADRGAAVLASRSRSASPRSCCPRSSRVSLSTGSRALARKRVLVKRLVTIEDLGNIEVLFTDKTGTLTEGAITFHAGPRRVRARASAAAFLLGLVCNEATMTPHGPGRRQRARRRPLAAPSRLRPCCGPPTGRGAYERLGLLPFDHERQLASVAGPHAPTARRCWSPRARPRPSWRAASTSPADEPGASCDGLFGDGARVVAVATRATPGPGAARHRRRARPAPRRAS